MTADIFLALVRQRLHTGAENYGDQSFDRPLPDLLNELEQEALDLAGWGFVTWERIRRLRAKAERVEAMAKETKQ